MPLVPRLRKSASEGLRYPPPPGRGGLRLVAAAAFVCSIGLGPRMVSAAPVPSPGDELTISVLTFGPGDHPFFKFGHNAILVHDDVSRADWVYNYGTFGFESPLLILDFLKGKLRYWLSVQSLRGTQAAYKRENRTIDQQVLNLTAEQKVELKRRLELNAEDANKYYKYDYYRDNCSTRVRDPIDAITNGSVKAVSVGTPAEMSWRAHTQRLVADSPAFYFALHVAMGDVIDKRIDVWQEMFLPAKLQETLRKAKVDLPCAEGAPPSTCGIVPLVKSERRILEATRGPLRTEPPAWTLRALLLGVVSGGLLAFVGDKAQGSRHARVAFGALIAGLGGLFGLLGCVFVMFWTLTDHEVAHRNENILQCAPWLIALTGTGIGVALGKEASTRRARALLFAAAVAALMGLVAKVLPMFDQDNAQIIAFTLPLWIGAAVGIHRLSGGTLTTLPLLVTVPVAAVAAVAAASDEPPEAEEADKDEEGAPSNPAPVPA